MAEVPVPHPHATRRGLRGFVVASLVGLSSFPFFFACSPADSGSGSSAGAVPETTQAPPKDSNAPTLVRAGKFTRGAIRRYVDADTDVQAEWRVDVYAKVGPAYVKELLVDEGQAVDAGQPLLLLDDVDFRIAHARALSGQATAKQKAQQAELGLKESEARSRMTEASFAKAEIDWNRATEAMNGDLDVLSKKELQDAKSEFDQRKAEFEASSLSMEGAKNDLEVAKLACRTADIELEKAQNDLDHCTVRSPIKGVIQERDVNAGLLVSSATHLFTIVDPTRLIAGLRINEDELPLIQNGLAVEFRFGALPNRLFLGKVEAVNPEVDPSSGQAKVRARLADDAIGVVKPGMYANVRIVVEARDDAVLVTKRAIVYQDGKNYLFLVDREVAGDVARRVEFAAGVSREGDQEVLSIEGKPVDTAREVIVVGQDRLRDGDRINVMRTTP